MIARIPVVLASVFLFAAGSTHARVVRFEVTHVRTFASGTSFGSVGQYQRLDGTAYFEVDPRDPHNAVIVNLDKAPRGGPGTSAKRACRVSYRSSAEETGMEDSNSQMSF